MSDQKRRGILDFLGHPLVQGVGLATAATGNPVLGLLAAPVIGGAREAMAAGNDEIRRQITERRDAMDSLPGLLAPISDDDLTQNPITGEPLSAGDVGNLPGVQAGRTNSAVEALMKIAPGPTTAHLLEQLMPSKRSPTGVLATAEALRAENRDLSLQQALAEAAKLHSSADPNAALVTTELLQRIAMNELEMDELNRGRQVEGLTITGTAENVMNTATSALELNRKLSGTFLEPGGLAAQAPRWALSVAELAAGVVDTEDARALREQIINLDKFKKDVVDLNTQVFAMLEGAGVSMSNQLRDQITAGSANISIDSRANQTIIFRTLERALAVAEQQGVQIPELREIQNNLIHRFEGNGSEPDGSAGLDAYLRSMEGFADMPPQQQAELRAMLIETLREAK